MTRCSAVMCRQPGFADKVWFPCCLTCKLLWPSPVVSSLSSCTSFSFIWFHTLLFLSFVTTSFLPFTPTFCSSTFLPSSPPPLICVGLSSEGDGQGESQVLDWLEEVEEGGSDWLNGFFTFLYGLINPLEPLEEEEGEHTASGRAKDVQEEDEEDENEEAVRGRRQAKDDGNQGQKIVIVGLHNQ